ncbi:MAG: hypothetical protein K2N73_04955 [Lachnospiraceae bacterium]|nr:hypothetical protein [Lachnospiraceae bacterium]
MSTISAGMPAVAESVSAYYNTSKTDRKSKTEEPKEDIVVTKKPEESKESVKKTQVGGKTIGKPELSEKAAKYYEELKKKYGNLDFILVSKDQKEFAKATASKYANPNKMVVLIDEEKIERMAEDEDFRKQYEGIISKGASGLSQLKNRLASMGMNVKSCGMKVNDNGAASFFATMDKSFRAQNKTAQQRLAKKKAAKKAEEKKEQKKAEQKKQQEKLEKSREERKDIEVKEDEVTFMADSIDELIQKIEDNEYLFDNGNIFSNRENKVGRKVDFII